MRLKTKKRGASNIIATLVIFVVMLSAITLAFSQVLPSVEKFQASSDFVAAENTFMNIDSSIKKLINSPENASEIIRYEINKGILDMSFDRSINLAIESEKVVIFNYSTLLGQLTYHLDGHYKGYGGSIYSVGSPDLLVYSPNRTTDVTNIVYQTFDGYKLLKLYYDIFVSIENVKSDEVEVNFILINLNTTHVNNNQKEYFPLINTEAKLELSKRAQILKSYSLGTFSTDLTINAETSNYLQKLDYDYAPSTSFSLVVNIITVDINFSIV